MRNTSLILRISAAVALLLAVTIGAGALPARSSLFFMQDNPCYGSTKLCEDGVHCGQSSECPGTNDNCKGDFFELPNNDRLWYCVCEDGSGSAPDPRNQPTWDCGIVGHTDSSNNPIQAGCFNSANCPGQCGGPKTDITTGCKSCSCP